ncbi:non-ribosomal peptide synthetase [Streptomyces albofaciens JCM 4342]|uniref:non-ribosomal peptide synthetase n=1 Tax=Streptomyces albofaciens TaxID=66866 RepID=UPI00123A1DCC|nr:non-ribosomal peptide synthetase [Streptomyces albofaciens]KAA6214827.1 non-ribosomal peptide synthetase [Streptomyces albofaciens JCM 4342]
MKTPSALEDVLPLAPLQEGLLFHALYDGQAPDIYNVQLVLRIEGEADAATLRASAGTLLARHANLRAGFRPRKNGQPIQVIHRTVPLPWREHDLTGYADGPDMQDAELERLLAADRAERFDLARPPLLRLTLYRLSDRRFCLALTCHHILLDGWSTPLVLSELFTLYGQGGSAAGMPRVTPYRDYLAWLGRQDRAAAEAAWQRALAGLEEPTLVAATDRTPEVPGRVALELSREDTARLTAAVRERRLTMSTLLNGVWAVALAQLTGRDDVVFGTTVSTRPADLPGSESMVGLFVNTVPVRVRLDQRRSLLDNLVRLQEEQSALLPHQYLGLGRIQQLADVGDLFDTAALLENYPLGTAEDEDVAAGLRLTEVDGRDATHYALNLVGELAGDRLALRLDHRADVMDRERATALLGRVRALLTSVLDTPDIPLNRVELISAAEREQALGTWNDTAHPLPGTHLAALFEAQAARTPQATAVVADGGGWTYAELNERANRLAHLLIGQGVGPEQLVALALPRSADLLVALLGVCKSGAAHLPLDPGQPRERIASTLADAAPSTVITAAGTAGAVAGTAVPHLVLDSPGTRAALAAQPATDPSDADRVAPLLPSHPAYALYTSGSTGRPKGVLTTHAGVCGHLAWMASTYPLKPRDRVLFRTAVSFDASVWEIWLPLITGAGLCVAPDDVVRDPERLVAFIARHGITVAQFVPSLLAELLRVPVDAALPLEHVFVGGEPIGAGQAAAAVAAWGVRVHNLYGPTETTVQVTAHDFDPAADTGTVPIGRPVWNTRLYVLDAALRPVPVGVAGELYVAGDQLARGYLKRPGLTAQRFVAHPYGAAGERLYRTGDVVRRRADGLLEYLERADDQVKIRGQRIEPGEVESVLAGDPRVGRAAVVVREDRPGDRRLVAYLVPAGEEGPDVASVRARAADVLPGYAVPSAFVVLDALPLTANAKLDRRALPAPEIGAAAGSRRPRDPREEILCRLFESVLGVPRVGIDDGFFDLGGHSLLAMRLISRVRAVLGVEPAVRDLFEAPTVARLAARLDGVAGARPALTRAAGRPGRVPLSFAQRRLWFLHQFEGPSATYNVPVALRLTGALDVTALRAALADLAERHESLRTVFPEAHGTPYQQVLEGAAARPALETADVGADRLDAAVREALARPFDLTGEAPLRAHVFTLAEDDHLLLLVAHHIASDGASAGPLLRDLSTAYRARCAGRAPAWAPLPVQYADYTLWQREVLGDENDPGSVLAGQIAYWKDTLSGLPDQLELPTDRPRPAVAGHQGASVAFQWDADLHTGLVRLAREHQASLFMVVQAGIAALLTRLGAGTDIPIGSPIAGRTDDALEDLVGFFVNTLVLRTDTSGDPSFAELLERVRETDLAAYAHQDVPFERLVEILNPTRSLSHHPLFQVILTFQNSEEIEADLPGAEVRDHILSAVAAKFDLSFTVEERLTGDGTPAGLRGSVEFAADLFEPDTARRIAERLERLLRAVAADAARPIGELEVLAAEERAQLLTGWNDTAHHVPAAKLPELFQAQVARTPDAVAVVHDREQLSYAELNARANRLAHHLIGRGVGPERIVALALPRSVDLVVAILAVLKTGAAYLPVDPDYPADRITYMLGDARPVLVLSDAATARTLPRTDIPVLDVPGTAGTSAGLPDRDPVDADRLLPAGVTNPAFVIYTSGSTGRPKGVVVEHRSLNLYLAWARSAYGAVGGRALVHSPVSFDLTVTGLFGPLTAGGCVQLVELTEESADELPERPTFVKATPSHLGLLLALPERFSPTGQLVLGGESLLGEILDEWRQRHPGVTVINEYGPTETTVGCTEFRIAPGAEAPSGVVTIGRPIWNTRMYVLDARLRPVPAGVTGELYIAGGLLARGYLNRPGQTAGRFVADPFAPSGARMYRTGDLAKWRADGQLEFVSRVDNQVKVRGYRIELGEIEAVVAAHPSVGPSAVIVREDRPGDKRITAYVTPADGHRTVDTAQLRAHAEEALPGYMLPSAFVVLDTLPLTPNGKLDHAALPAPEAAAAPDGRGPRTAQEEVLCDIFAEVLGVERVGIDDNFFDLGGHSLLAMRLISRIRTAFDIELSVRDLFEAPTVAGVAARQADTPQGNSGPAPMDRPERIPLSFAQRRLWFLHQLEGPSPTYNVPLLLRLTGTLDVPALRAALADLTGRHESLRTVFPHAEGTPYQLIRQGAAGWPTVECVRPAPDELESAVTEAVRYAFDLTREIPLRAWLFETGPQEHTLLLLIHHIAGDGASVGPLARDLSTAYGARRAGRAPAWAPLPVQYADYTLWQRDVLGDEHDPRSVLAGQVAYWKDTLSGLPDQLELPTDRPRPAVAGHQGGTVEFAWDTALHQDIARLAREHRASVFMVLQAAVATLLTHHGAGTDIPLGTATAGRADEALDDLVGFFVNTLVLRTDTSGDPTFAELLARVREADLAAYAHQDVPFERLVEIVNPLRTLARHPLFQVAVGLEETTGAELEMPGLTVEHLPDGMGVAKVDLAFNFAERVGDDGRPDGLRGVVEFATDLFERETARAFAERLERLLRAVVADAARPIGELDVLGAEERERLLTGWNDTAYDVPAATFPELFQAQVARDPAAPALEFEDVTLSYAELNARANRLAHHLIGRGAGPERTVALVLPRSVDLVVAILAVLKAGAAYLPVDPDYPADRIAHMLADTRPALVLTCDGAAGGLPGTGVPVLRVANLAPGADHDPTDADRTTGLLPDHPAYVIYTSGSTGRPKGVVVAHRGLANLSAHQTERLGAGPGCRVSQLVSPSFDVSVAELSMGLLAGACLVMPAEQPAGEELADFLAGRGITHAHVPPALLTAMPRRELPRLVSLMVGAEACPPDVIAYWSRGQRMVNAYGPTEATVDSCYALCGPHQGPGRTPIGRPVFNTRLYVLDDLLRPVPAGVTGELYIAGRGLARGYLGRPALTAGRFVADPYSGTGERMYRTGDLVRRRHDGQLEFVGRVDGQVKVRGFRIELGEIENVLLEHPAVGRAAVIVREDRPGDKRITAYVVPDQAGTDRAGAPEAGAGILDIAELREWAAGALPEYMLPSAFVVLDALPLTPNAKLDRAALPAPRVTGAEGGRGPRTAREEALCALFAEVLGVERVGIDDNFFDLGGHSLLAARFVGRVRAAYGVDFRVRDLFAAPSVAAIAGRLDTGRDGSGPGSAAAAGNGLDVLLPLRTTGDRTPLFCAPPTVPLSWCYTGLLKELGPDCPLYGLQSPGLDGTGELPRDFAQMIEEYVTRIQQVQPVGPYRLLGYSLGGNIAQALATRLQERGEEVELVAVLDAYPGGDAAPVPLTAAEALARFHADLCGDGGGTGDPARMRTEVIDSLRPGLPGDLTEEQLSRLLDAMTAAVGNTSRYEPRVYKGDLLLFTTTVGRPDHGAMPAAWQPLTDGEVVSHLVPATHDGLLEGGGLRAVGAVLSERLRALDAARGK